MRKISLISSSRGDYGIMKNLIIKLQKDKDIKFNFYPTGSLLQNRFGNNLNLLKKDKIKITKKINIDLLSDKNLNVSLVISAGIKKFTKEFQKNKPDILVILGDRYEIFSVAIAAMINQIPIAHIHGGESSEGVIDEAIRHSITKMSHLHFVSNKEHFNRVLQLGEKKENIFNVGSLGVENAKKINLLLTTKTIKKFNLDLKKKIFVITLHPETLNNRNTKKNTQTLLNALKKFKNTNFIFTMPNAESGYKEICNQIIKFCKKYKDSFFFKSLGQDNYFAICKHAHCIIGNSSSGIIESPSLLTPSVDIGNRQLGRVRAESVINSRFNVKSIIKSIKECLKLKNTKKKYSKFKNPYEKKKTTDRIIKVLKSKKLENILLKNFKDLHIKFS